MLLQQNRCEMASENCRPLTQDSTSTVIVEGQYIDNHGYYQDSKILLDVAQVTSPLKSDCHALWELHGAEGHSLGRGRIVVKYHNEGWLHLSTR